MLSKSKIPKLRRHKPSQRAVVTLSGQDHYVGPWPNSKKTPDPVVQEAYLQLVGEWISNGRQKGVGKFRDRDTPPAVSSSITIEQVLASFLKHASTYYRDEDGKETGELLAFKSVMKTIRKLYAKLPAVEFGPLCLKACRQELIRQDIARRVINNYIARMRMIFKWAASEELIPGSIPHALSCVAPLKAGRSAARETPKIIPPDDEIINKVLDGMPHQLGSMFRLMQYSGMRAGEVAVMKVGDIDRTGEVWKYTVRKHKNAWRGKERIVFLGRTSQTNLNHFLEPTLTPEQYVFSPKRVESLRRDERKEKRKTPRWNSHMTRNKMKRKPNPTRAAGDRYTTQSINRLLRRECMKRFPMPERLRCGKDETRKQFIERIGEAGLKQIAEHKRRLWFSPHKLRHYFATKVRSLVGLEAARAALGHSTAKMTEHYAELDQSKAIEAADHCG